MRFWLVLCGALLSALVAALLLLGAYDVQRWEQGLSEGDVRFRTEPIAEDLWQVSATLPGNPVRDLLGVEDDLRYRRVIRAFFLARPRVIPGPRFTASAVPRLELARGEAQVQLTNLMGIEKDARRLSQENNLQGALALAVVLRQQTEQRRSTLQAAAGYFTEAIRLDATNEDAMYNLELTLEMLRTLPEESDAPRGGKKPLEAGLVGGSQRTGAGY
jgi:hypothetical protein